MPRGVRRHPKRARATSRHPCCGAVSRRNAPASNHPPRGRCPNGRHGPDAAAPPTRRPAPASRSGTGHRPCCRYERSTTAAARRHRPPRDFQGTVGTHSTFPARRTGFVFFTPSGYEFRTDTGPRAAHNSGGRTHRNTQTTNDRHEQRQPEFQGDSFHQSGSAYNMRFGSERDAGYCSTPVLPCRLRGSRFRFSGNGTAQPGA